MVLVQLFAAVRIVPPRRLLGSLAHHLSYCIDDCAGTVNLNVVTAPLGEDEIRPR